MGCRVVLHRPGCGDKALLQPRSGQAPTGLPQPWQSRQPRHGTARLGSGCVQGHGWQLLTLQVLDQLAPELVAVGDVSVGQQASS